MPETPDTFEEVVIGSANIRRIDHHYDMEREELIIKIRLSVTEESLGMLGEGECITAQTLVGSQAFMVIMKDDNRLIGADDLTLLEIPPATGEGYELESGSLLIKGKEPAADLFESSDWLRSLSG